MEPRAGFEPATSALPRPCFNGILIKFERFCAVDLQLSPVTVKDHSSGVSRLLRRMQKEYWQVSKEDLRAFLFNFKQDHAPATVAGIIKTLRVFYRDFLRCHELVDSFKFPNIPYRPKIIPSKEEVQKFYNCLDSSFAEALFLFYASSGLRKGEVLSLNVEDIDFKQRMVVPSNHTGTTKCSYVSFFNSETEKALNKLDKINKSLLHRTFPYGSHEHMIEALKTIYPHMGELFIINLDDRDSENIPSLKTKNFRGLRIIHSKSNCECSFEAHLKLVLVLVEDGMCYVKSATLGDTDQY